MAPTPTKGAAGDGTAGVGRARPRRPLSLLAGLGAVIAMGYGHLVLGMRFGPPLVMVGLGGMTLAFCAAALWRVIDPLTRDEVSAPPDTRAPYRLRELEREKQAVLKAIKEIELDYQMRKISESDYREMVERYRARALRVMGDLATGDDYRALIERELKARVAAQAAAAASAERTSGSGSGTAPANPPRAPAAPDRGAAGPIHQLSCSACGGTNDGDARYCKQCGKPLTISADSA